MRSSRKGAPLLFDTPIPARWNGPAWPPSNGPFRSRAHVTRASSSGSRRPTTRRSASCTSSPRFSSFSPAACSRSGSARSSRRRIPASSPRSSTTRSSRCTGRRWSSYSWSRSGPASRTSSFRCSSARGTWRSRASTRSRTGSCLRAAGMTFMRITLFTWSVLVTSFLLVLAMPFLTVAGILLLFDRMAGTNFFAVGQGADPLLWQYLFWFFGHPEVYIMILPGFGVISEVLPVFSRKPIFGYRMIAYSSAAIGFLSFGVFVHHMFVAGIDPALQVFFMASTMLIAVPTGVKIFSWLGTLWGGALRFRTAMLFAMAFIVVFTIGGISGVFLGSVPVDVQLSDTYFVVAHIHYVLVQGALFCAFAAFYYWMPKMSGRLLSEQLGRIHFFLFFIGVNLAFFPMHQLGLDGMPRRTFHYPQSPEWASLNLVSTIGAYIIGISVAVFLFNFFSSIVLKNGRIAGDDPWEADTLEWATTSPPQPYNFARIPVVHSARPLKEDVAH